LYENLQNDTAAELYQNLAKFNTDMSIQSLKVGATLNEYLNKEIKYQAKCVPDAFRQYHALVEQTSSLLD